MIQIHSLAIGAFEEIEPFNSAFSPGHPKLRITVDTEIEPRLPDARVLEVLAAEFPGLARHQCRAEESAGGTRAGGTQILLIESDSSANQAHLLEHLTLDMLGTLDRRVRRLSGVTCAYAAPRQRNDVFVECYEAESGGFAARLAAEAMNAVLAGLPLTPLYPDAVRCARMLRWRDERAWTARRLAKLLTLPLERAGGALEVLSRAHLVEPESYSMNFSGEPCYRTLGAGLAAAR